jgi:hypothetical protein
LAHFGSDSSLKGSFFEQIAEIYPEQSVDMPSQANQTEGTVDSTTEQIGDVRPPDGDRIPISENSPESLEPTAGFPERYFGAQFASVEEGSAPPVEAEMPASKVTRWTYHDAKYGMSLSKLSLQEISRRLTQELQKIAQRTEP